MKRVIDGQKVINAGDMEFDIYSDEIELLYLDNVGIIAEFSGASPDGKFLIQVKNGDSQWVELTLSSPINIGPPGGVSSPIVVNLTDVPFSKLRIFFDANVGSAGVMSAWLSAKSK